MFEDVLGQRGATETLRLALANDQVHHAYRFEGPRGVGKEKTAFLLAQYLICPESVGGGSEGTARSVHRIHSFSDTPPHTPLHPDLILVERGLYPPQLLGASSGEVTGIGVEQIRRIVLARTGLAPHEGRKLVVIIRAAEELTIAAANALLKTLEEPPAWVNFVLLTSRPHRLLDTIRSRTLAVRFAPLADRDVAALLRARDLDESVAPLAQGSMSEAFQLVDPERAELRRQFIDQVLAAMRSRTVADALDLSGGRLKDRHELREQLRALAQHFAAEARQSIERAPTRAEVSARAFESVAESIVRLEQNAQPALALEALLCSLRELVEPSRSST